MKKIVKIPHRGGWIYGVRYLPECPGRCPIVVASHGYGGSHEDFTELCERLAAEGIGAYAYDFGGGSVKSKSSGMTTDMSVLTEKEELCAVLDAVQSWEDVDRNNIFVVGASQGGFVTALAAEGYADAIRGMLLMFPAFCIPDDWNKRYPQTAEIPESFEFWGLRLGRRYALDVHGMDPFALVGCFGGPVLILHGDSDQVVQLGYSVRLKERYANCRLEVFPGQGHCFSPQESERAWEMAAGFVKENRI